MILGLTGNIACGKSAVAALLAGFGATVLDADKLVHELYSDPAFSQQVAALFAAPILTPEGTVDRAKVAPLVFGDRAALRRLETLVHPAVARLRDQKLAAWRHRPDAPHVVLEAVKLVESGQARQCDAVWCVTCRPEIQLQRLMQARGLAAGAAQARLHQQPPLEAKAALLGAMPFVIIENNGSLENLARQAQEEWDKFISGGSG